MNTQEITTGKKMRLTFIENFEEVSFWRSFTEGWRYFFSGRKAKDSQQLKLRADNIVTKVTR